MSTGSSSRAERVAAVMDLPTDVERGEWDLPCGRPDVGEDHRAALKREVQEEAGLAVEVGAPLDEHLFEVLPGRFVRIVPFVCHLTGASDVVDDPFADIEV